MSDSQKLKDTIAEYDKANRQLNDKLKQAQQESQQGRREQEAQPSRY